MYVSGFILYIYKNVIIGKYLCILRVQTDSIAESTCDLSRDSCFLCFLYFFFALDRSFHYISTQLLE